MRLPLFALSTVLLTTASLQAAPATKALAKKFARLDLNDDELLDRSEFAKILPAKWTQNGALDDTQEAMFLWFDVDRDNGIDLGEWLDGKAWDSTTFPHFSSSTVAELDTNANGKLSWGEFNRVIGRFVPVSVAHNWYSDPVPFLELTGPYVELSAEGSITFGGFLQVNTLNSYSSYSTWEGFDFGSITVIAVGPDTLISAENTFTGSTLTEQGSLNGISASWAAPDPAASTAHLQQFLESENNQRAADAGRER